MGIKIIMVTGDNELTAVAITADVAVGAALGLGKTSAESASQPSRRNQRICGLGGPSWPSR